MKTTNRIIKVSVVALTLIVAVAVIFSQFISISAEPVDIAVELVEPAVAVEEDKDITVEEAPILLAVQAPKVEEKAEVDPVKEIIKNGLAQVKAVYQIAINNIKDYDVRHEVDLYYKTANRAIADINEGDDYEATINLVISEFSKAVVRIAGNVIDLSVQAYKELAFELVDAKVEQLTADEVSSEIISAFYEAEFTKISIVDSVEAGKLVLAEVQNDVM